MKTWISFLWILTVVLAPQAGAALTSEELAQIPAINHLTNGGFENGAYSWVASGGATKTVNSTAKANNNSGYDWDSNGASQTLRSATIPIPNALKGRNAVLSCLIKGVASGSTHTVTVDDGSGNPMFTAQTIVAPTNTFKRNSFNFPMNSSGNFRVEFKSVAADEPELYIDDCGVYEADKFNLSQVNQSEIIGTVFYPQTSGCSWTFSGTSYGAASAQSSCPTPTVTGVFNTSAGKIPGGNISQLPPGNYEVIINAVMLPYTAGSPAMDGSFTVGTSVSDSNGRTETGSAAVYSLGTGSSVPTIPQSTVVGFFSYLNAQSNVTLQMKGKTSNASNPAVANNSTASYTNGFLLTLKRFPLSSETAYRPELYNWRVDANISGANPSLGTSSVSSYTGIENGSLTLTNNSGDGVIPAMIGCSSTNAPSGTTCSAGNESLSISYFQPAKSDVIACASFTHSFQNPTGATLDTTFQIVETAVNSQTVIQEGKSRIASGAFQNINGSAPYRVCGTFSLQPGQRMLRLMYEQVVGGTPTSNTILADAASTVGQRDIHWEVYPINQSLPAPILVGSVTSNTNGTERVERLKANITSTTVGSIVSQSGSWATLSSVASSVATFAITGFSATPTCVCTPEADTAADCAITDAITSSTLKVAMFRSSTEEARTGVVNVVCMGPR